MMLASEGRWPERKGQSVFEHKVVECCALTESLGDLVKTPMDLKHAQPGAVGRHLLQWANTSTLRGHSSPSVIAAGCLGAGDLGQRRMWRRRVQLYGSTCLGRPMQ